jgi:DNA modification methylase
MLYGYFEDMYLTMLRMNENLKPGGKVAIVVSNVRFSGINIPVDEILGEIALNIGFENVNILIARYRGNSAQQMKTYDRIPSRESIITFEKPYA